MTLLELFLTFAKIGLFTFGGGYGMIPLIQQEVVGRGWMDAQTLLNYIGICESTPGPIAVNMATFVGASRAGLMGSLCATLGVVLPSFAVILLIAAALGRFRENPLVRGAMAGIRPVVAGMIAATGACALIRCVIGSVSAPSLDVRQLAIFAALGGGMCLWKRRFGRPISPILLIVASAVLGMVAYGV